MTDHFEESVKAQNEAHKAEVLRDQYNDMSGVNVGRMTRTVFKGADLDANGRKRKNTFDLIDAILTTKEYEALHIALMDDIGDTRAKADNIANQIETAIEKAENRLTDVLDNAITLPDGRKAFLDAETGIAWADDGSRLDDALTAGIDWSGKAPYSDYLKAKENLDKLRDYQIQTEQIIHGLAEDQNTLEDTRNGGLSNEEREEIRERLEGHENQLDDISNGVAAIGQPQHSIQASLESTQAEMSILPPSSN